MDLKEKLEKALKIAGTQRHLAKLLGCSTSTVSMWYTGSNDPSWSMMVRLNQFLDKKYFDSVQDDINAINQKCIKKEQG